MAIVIGDLQMQLNKVRKLRTALELVRSKGICAGAAFVLRKEGAAVMCTEYLDIIDSALKESE
jgi:Zn finger protein HypA/HybF involved in hydrogenase expression